jgi:outer membrane receptor protein involved in Fe transport
MSPILSGKPARKLVLLSTSAIISAAFASGALAAEALPTTDAPPDSAALEAVVVTASRVERAGFTAPTPTTVVGTQEMQARAPANVADILNEAPAFRPTVTPTQRTVFGGAGQNQADLRGLGSRRTLVLMDGRRFVPSSATGTVDINLVPTIMLDRTEVVTGGASAAWGSDAVAGVVNFITNRNLNGVKADASYGESKYGDAHEQRYGFAAGTSLGGDRGHITFGAEYVKLGKADYVYFSRPWGKKLYGLISVPAANARPAGQPSRFYSEQVQTCNEPAGGIILGVNSDTNPNNGVDVLRGIRFGPGGQRLPWSYGTVYGINSVGGCESNYTGTGGYLTVPLNRWSTLANVDYKITDTINMFAQFSLARSSAHYISPSRRDFVPAPGALVDYILIKRDNAFLPGDIASIMDANRINSFYLGRGGNDIGDRPYARGTNETTRIVLGFDGTVFDKWKWSAYYQFGRNELDQIYRNLSLEPNYQRAYDAVRNAQGQIVCRVNQTSVVDSACKPLNLFGIGVADPEAIAYTLGTNIFNVEYRQQVAAADVNGEPFSTWAGPVSLAAGVEWRREDVEAVADAASMHDLFDYQNLQPYKGGQTVKEAYAETVVPLAKDQPFAKTLDLNAAVRLTDYNISGSVTTWKVGATYEPVDWVRFRATRSRDIRAPNLGEVFGIAKATVNGINPYTRVANGPVNGTTGGNPNLTPEIGDTWTAGVVLQPNTSFLRGLRLSVDYYDIKIKDAIATYSVQQILDNCRVEIDTNAPKFFCNYVQYSGAGPTWTLLTMTTVPFNLTKQTASGFDIEASYSLPVWGGNLGFRALVTLTEDQTNYDVVGHNQNAGYLSGAPTVVGNFTTNYRKGPASVSLQARYIGHVRINNTFIGPDESGYSSTRNNSVSDNINPAVVYFNLSAQYDIINRGGTRVQLYGVVNNLLDKAPPYTGASFYYDSIGRFIKGGIRLNF